MSKNIKLSSYKENIEIPRNIHFIRLMWNGSKCAKGRIVEDDYR